MAVSGKPSTEDTTASIWDDDLFGMVEMILAGFFLDGANKGDSVFRSWLDPWNVGDTDGSGGGSVDALPCSVHLTLSFGVVNRPSCALESSTPPVRSLFRMLLVNHHIGHSDVPTLMGICIGMNVLIRCHQFSISWTQRIAFLPKVGIVSQVPTDALGMVK